MPKMPSKKLIGMTLIEMLMAIFIFIIGMEGFTALFIQTWKNNAYTIEMGQSSLSVSQGLSHMVDYIRRARQGDDGSYPIQSADDNDLIIYCDYNKDGTTERLHFYKNGQNVLMGITRPTLTIPKTYPAGDQETLTLLNYIVNNSGESIFEYFNKDYPLDMSHNPVSTPAPVAEVRLAKIYLEININPNRGPENIKMQSFVEMRNLNDYNQIP